METPEERKQRQREARAERERRDQRVFVASSRGITVEEIALQFGMTARAVAKVIAKKQKAFRDTGEADADNIRIAQLVLIKSYKQYWATRAAAEAVEAASENNKIPEGRALGRVLQLLAEERKAGGVDTLQITGDPDNPIKIEADTARLLQEFVELAISAVKPFPGAGEAIIAALAQKGSEETESE